MSNVTEQWQDPSIIEVSLEGPDVIASSGIELPIV